MNSKNSNQGQATDVLEPLATIDEVAAHLRVSVRTVAGLVSSNAIPFHRIGKKCLRFRISEVLAASTVPVAIRK